MLPRSTLLNLGAGRPAIQVLEAGEGSPLFFLHGAGGISAWEGVLPLLSQHFHVYAPLLPGFGESTGLECLEDQFDLFMHGFDLIDALGLDRPYVVGESMGGWMAAEMAALRPKGIGRLALAAPVGLWRDEAPVVDLFGCMINELVPYLYHDQSCNGARQMQELTQLFSDKDDRTQEQIETLIGMSRGFRTAAKFLFPIPESGLEHRLWRITAPTLIVWGEQDRFISPTYADIFREKITNSEVVKVPNTGHVISLESPEPLAKALLRWGGES
ncbi:MAG TPA: alpha/beta hydrolase [Blastocatellia bacterium]|jgi:pimeloyl-ACP methyl ester carboxylesterase|nr:alpha/beta hydrolase [Blastocatellia bacterium]